MITWKGSLTMKLKRDRPTYDRIMELRRDKTGWKDIAVILNDEGYPRNVKGDLFTTEGARVFTRQYIVDSALSD